jgi:DNA-binding response OmpR family regulator
MRVLLIEDEPHLGSAVQEHVRAAGHAVDWFERLEPAEHAVLTVSYDALLLDLHLPDGRGLDLMRCRLSSSPRATSSATGSRGLRRAPTITSSSPSISTK